MKLITYCLASCLTVTSLGAAAAGFDPAVPRCVPGDDRILDRMLASLQTADELMPNVPPEEEKYLVAESAAVKRVMDEEAERKVEDHSRWLSMNRALRARPLYFVWAARNDLSEARRQIQAIRATNGVTTYRNSPEAEKLERATHAISALSRYAKSLEAALDSPVVKVPVPTSFSLYAGLYLNHDLGRFMSCKLARVMGKQEF